MSAMPASFEQMFHRFEQSLNRQENEPRLIIAILGLIVPPFLAVTFLVAHEVRKAFWAAALAVSMVAVSSIGFILPFFDLLLLPIIIALFVLWMMGVVSLLNRVVPEYQQRKDREIRSAFTGKVFRADGTVEDHSTQD